MEDLTEIVKKLWPIATGVATAIGTLLVSYKKVNRRYVQPFLKRRRQLRLLCESQEDLTAISERKVDIIEMLGRDAADSAKLHEVLALLKPNGGSSIADSLNRIERQNVIDRATQRLLFVEDSEILFWADPIGRYYRVSKAYSDLVGRISDELLNEGWKSHIAVEYRKAVAEEWSFAVRDQREFYMTCVIENHSTHQRMTVDIKAVPAKINGKAVGYVGKITLL